MPLSPPALDKLAHQIKQWSVELGFQQCGISDCDLHQAEEHLQQWLARGHQGEMDYMARHGQKRTRPDLLVPGTARVISLRMDYLPPAAPAEKLLNHPERGYISRYALGRDYHKVVRHRLKQLTQKIAATTDAFDHRPFVDSAPVMERAIAEKAGLGWIGKHSNLINRRAGSWFFLGEIYTSLPLPVDAQTPNHCGRCQACIDICPSNAIVAPYQVDARRCISYLTIELKGPIPLALRPLIGNRIYGCDDCQLICPWNRFAKPTDEADFMPRHGLDQARLIELIQWDEPSFLKRTEGSAIRRIGYQSWQRNIAVALGNGPSSPRVIQTLQRLLNKQHSAMVAEHLHWALSRLVK